MQGLQHVRENILRSLLIISARPTAVCAAACHLFFHRSPRKSQLFLSCLCLINETLRIVWSTVSLHPCCPLKALATATAGSSQEESKAMGFGRDAVVGWRQAGFYLGISSLLGWPRRWEMDFLFWHFPNGVILQGAEQEVGVIPKGEAVLAG